MIASEAIPFAKTGGLGDVAGVLPIALGRLGHQVTLVVPQYRGIAGGTQVERFPLAVGGRTLDVAISQQELGPGATVALVDCPELFDRPELYGTGGTDFPDNALRFAAFTRAALEFAGRHTVRPDVVHAHDWQAGLAPVYLRTLYAGHPQLARVGLVFTIHNLAYQGLFPPHWMPALDLGWELFGIDGLEFWGKVSFLKAGINFSDVVTTVSAKYAKEIQTAEYGFGFDGVLRRRSDRLVGILNGIDVETWDPALDPHLPEPYDVQRVERKGASKRELLEQVGLPTDAAAMDRPLVGMVSRLVDQKGFDLLAGLGERLLALDATFVLLGSGEPRYQAQWKGLAERAPDRVAVRIGFDERLAHLIEGGSDLFLMPSRFEPCGLNQMYSLRYGTVPVVRATGGLDDTILNWNPRTGRGTGFKFAEATPEALLATLRSALEVYRDPAAWRKLQLEGMSCDFSWDASARQYLKVYERATRYASTR